MNLFARVEIDSALFCIALGIPDKSLNTDFLAHSTPHFTRAVPYFTVLFAIHVTAGATSFSATGQSIAPHAIHVAISPPVGRRHSSSHV